VKFFPELKIKDRPFLAESC